MQFLVYDPNFDPNNMASEPTPEMMMEMGQFIGEAMAANKVVVTGGVMPTGTRLKLADGKFSVTDGPFIELKELTAGFAVIRADSLEEAITWCKRFRQIIGDGESEIVQIMGPEDLAMHE
jgi:hypothetical protein